MWQVDQWNRGVCGHKGSYRTEGYSIKGSTGGVIGGRGVIPGTSGKGMPMERGVTRYGPPRY